MNLTDKQRKDADDVLAKIAHIANEQRRLLDSMKGDGHQQARSGFEALRDHAEHGLLLLSRETEPQATARNGTEVKP